MTFPQNTNNTCKRQFITGMSINFAECLPVPLISQERSGTLQCNKSRTASMDLHECDWLRKEFSWK